MTKAAANSADASQEFLIADLDDKISKGVSELNAILAQGIQIPEISLGRLTNTNLVNHDDYIVLQTDYALNAAPQLAVQMVVAPFQHLINECFAPKNFKGKFRNFFLANQAKISSLLKLVKRN